MAIGYYNFRATNKTQNANPQPPAPGIGWRRVDGKAVASPRTSRRTRKATVDQIKEEKTTSPGSITITAEQFELFKRQGFEIRRLEQALGAARAAEHNYKGGKRGS